MKGSIAILFFICVTSATNAQQADTNKWTIHSQKTFLQKISGKYSRLSGRVNSYLATSLNNLRTQDAKIYRKLKRKDSAAAAEFLEESNKVQAMLRDKLSIASKDTNISLKEYIPAFDTATSTLSFLSQQSNTVEINEAVKASQKQLKEFESRMQIANEIKRQLRERKRMLAQQLEKFGLTKELNKYSKQIYYYQEQLNEFKSLLKDHKKAERKALALLAKNEQFKSFMKNNSILAQMFRIPAEQGTQGVNGLQTRTSVNAMLLQRFAGVGLNPQEQAQQQMNAAQAELNKIKTKINSATKKSSSDIDMPSGFKPNTQKTKSFLKRLTYEANFHTQKIQITMTDIALTAGYKINDHSVLSVGGSARIGLGKGWNNIRLTNEGFGLRSVLDWKLKYNIWGMGSYETSYYNRHNTQTYSTYSNAWQANILLGLMKKIQLNSKKNSTVRLAYNLLYKQNNFLTQPIVFQIGYGF